MIPWTVVRQAPLFMGFPKQEYCSGLPFPSLSDLPDLGIKSASPVLAGGFSTAEPPGKANFTVTNCYKDSVECSLVLLIFFKCYYQHKHGIFIKTKKLTLVCYTNYRTIYISPVFQEHFYSILGFKPSYTLLFINQFL